MISSELPPAIPPSPELRVHAPRSRLVSLDAFRGLIMLCLVTSLFGLGTEAKKYPDSAIWQTIAFHAEHPTVWQSRFYYAGVSFWDLIQPSFMFMAGMGLGYSVIRRQGDGESYLRRYWHVLLRSITLILLGVFLRSLGAKQTNWTFVDVISQIGLGYPFLFLLAGRSKWLQLLALITILAGYWGWFVSYPIEGATTWADHFQKNNNPAHAFDVWFLNLFPREIQFVENSGGYQTLNFVPSLATMLLGLMTASYLQRNDRPAIQTSRLALSGLTLLGLGVAAGETICPVIKFIWTPSWVLFSAGWVLLMLAGFHAISEWAGLHGLVGPLAVMGMNSILLYVLSRWSIVQWVLSQVKLHFGGIRINIGNAETPPLDFSHPVVAAGTVGLIYFLLCLWLYRRRIFIRI